MFSYFSSVWNARYFWWHLAMSDLRARWRRSFFGIFWSILQPLGLTLLISLVFGRFFDINMIEYAPYILSGMLVWDYVMSSIVIGSLSFVQSESYIKQTVHPLAIYTLRSAISGLVIFLMASTSLLLWVLVVMPGNFGWSWIASILIFPILWLIAWPLVTISAYISTRFRDFPHALGLIMQAIWFVSPIYFEAAMFRKGNMQYFIDYNPIYHLLEIVRAPLLRGDWPTFVNFYWCSATVIALSSVAFLMGRRSERKVIFYL